jgi:hypothetical protein
VDKGKLSIDKPLVVRTEEKTPNKKKLRNELLRNIYQTRNDLTPEDAADDTYIEENEPDDPKMRVEIAESGDMIFNPLTAGTKYAIQRTAKINLERRMPGCFIRVVDMQGEGMIRFSITASYNVNDKEVVVEAMGLASPSDMTITSANLAMDMKTYDVDPVDQARSPEEASRFLQRLAANCANL